MVGRELGERVLGKEREDIGSQKRRQPGDPFVGLAARPTGWQAGVLLMPEPLT